MAAQSGAELTRFVGKTALVIGAGSVADGIGNGRATAMLLAREGAFVLCADLNLEAAENTVSRIKQEGGAAKAIQLDATDPAALDAMVADKTVNILVHVVGISVPGGVIDTVPEDWDRVFAINLRSAFLAARACLPGMIKREQGVLVFVSSLASVYSSGYSYAAYEASKAGLNRLTCSIARSHAAQGVRANAVLPGMIDTPHVQTYIMKNQSTDDKARANAVPMKRQGSPWDVAEAIAFLASDQSAYITGVCLPVDGGLGL